MQTLKHIVMWKFKEEAEGCSREENIEKVISGLSALMGVVPELKHIELHPDILHSSGSYDLMLTCCVDSMDAMQAYQVHPAHVEMKSFIHKVITDRATVDFMVNDPDPCGR